MVEWKEYNLYEIGEVLGGATPSTKNAENYDGNIAWLTPKDLSSFTGRYISKGERSITEQGYKSCSTRMLPEHSILFSSRAPIGYIAIAANELCTNQGFKSIIPNEKVDYLFLYYLLKYKRNDIERMGSGTTFKEVSGNVMKNIKVSIPTDIEIQKRIANVLDKIDCKIENNNAINRNLQKQANSIFQKEFINIDEVPNNWKEGNLLDIADYLNGLAMQKFRPSDDEVGLPVLKIKELRHGSCDASSELCSPTIKSEYIVHDGDVVFSWSGSLVVDFWCGGDCGLNQHLFKVTSKKYDKWFYYAWTLYHLDRFIAIAVDKATTMGHIKREELSKSKVLLPSKQDYDRIGGQLQPMYDLIVANRIESRRLAELRDSLLPKLMSGKMDVSELDT